MVTAEADIRKLPPEAVDVIHEPMSPRYFRAFDKKKIIIKSDIFLGNREAESDNSHEIAMCLPHPLGGKRCGYFACFRLFYSGRGELVSATMFCFYDGTDKSPCFRTRGSAEAFARSEGFRAPKSD